MKKGIFVGALVTLLCIPSYAYAKGTATVEFTGNRSANVGDEFKVNMVIDNVTDAEGGIVGYAGYIKFDDSVLEIVDAKTANNYFDVYKNDSINKIVGIDMTLNHGITSRTAVYEITFRGINEGNTTVTLTGADLSDRDANEVDANVNGLNVTINAVKPVVEEVKPVYTAVKEEKVQTQETVVEDTADIKEDAVEQKEEKTTEKVAKKSKKEEKNLLKIVSDFIKKIFKKVA